MTFRLTFSPLLFQKLIDWIIAIKHSYKAIINENKWKLTRFSYWAWDDWNCLCIVRFLSNFQQTRGLYQSPQYLQQQRFSIFRHCNTTITVPITITITVSHGVVCHQSMVSVGRRLRTNLKRVSVILPRTIVHWRSSTHHVDNDMCKYYRAIDKR